MVRKILLLLFGMLSVCSVMKLPGMNTLAVEQQKNDAISNLNEQLIFAVLSGTLEDVNKVLSQGLYLFSPQLSKSSLLHNAAFNPDIRIIRFLIDQGFPVTTQTESSGYSPLHSAVHAGLPENVKILVTAGAFIDARTNLGKTALHLACSQNNGVLVKLLLELGANTEIQDNNHLCPIHEAIWQETAAALEELITGKANLEAQDGNCTTPLLLSARRGFSQGIEMLLAAGAISSVRGFHENDDLTLSFQQTNDIFLEVIHSSDEQSLRTLIKRSYCWLIPSEAMLRSTRIRVFEALFCMYKNGLDDLTSCNVLLSLPDTREMVILYVLSRFKHRQFCDKQIHHAVKESVLEYLLKKLKERFTSVDPDLLSYFPQDLVDPNHASVKTLVAEGIIEEYEKLKSQETRDTAKRMVSGSLPPAKRARRSSAHEKTSHE